MTKRKPWTIRYVGGSKDGATEIRDERPMGFALDCPTETKAYRVWIYERYRWAAIDEKKREYVAEFWKVMA